jgi:hypothetical protein
MSPRNLHISHGEGSFKMDCRVAITDIEGGGHVVEVKASFLFDAVAQAEGREHRNGRIPADQSDGLQTESRTRGEAEGCYCVVERSSRSPRELVQRQKLRQILGL